MAAKTQATNERKKMKEIAEVKVETMTSREIAELTGRTHDNVLKKIDIIASNLTESSKSITYKGYNNQDQREWVLTKRDSLLVVSGYSVELRANIIDRWEQLEEVVKDLDVISKVKAIALTGDFNAATKAVSDLCNDSEQIGKVGSKLMTERKRQKKEVKKLIEEVSARFQLDLF